MPKINRFRVVNFKYDNDKKYIGDMLLDMHGQNTLINLENGGGKSVILQLALQVLIPNTELSSRKFVDYFRVNSGTVHILIEWLLDSTVKEYLLTGICAARDQEGLKFFTYTHAYGMPNECDIRQIPVVNSRKQVTGYSEFYKHLRGMTKLRINTYSKDRMTDYKNKLAASSLFGNEFEAIKVINQSEGGIEKFFERARKSRNVIERLIIPAIPSLGGEEQSLLAGTFKKHLENLKNIPVLQYNLQVYEEFLEKGLELLKLLEEYQGLAGDCSEFKGEILILENIIHVVLKRLSEELKGYQSQLEELDIAEHTMNYKRDSLEILLEKRKMQGLQEKLNDKGSVLDKERRRLESVLGSIKKMQASNAFLDLKEQRNRHLELGEKLRLLTLEEDEIHKEHQDCLFYLSGLLEKEIGRVTGQIEAYSAQAAAARQELESKQEQGKKLSEERQSVSNQLAVKDAEKVRLEKEYCQYAGRFNSRDMTLLLDPVDSLTRFEVNREKLANNKLELENRLKQFSSREEDARTRLSNVSSDKKALEERLAGKKQLELFYTRKLASIEEQLKVLGIDDGIYSVDVEEKLRALADKTASFLEAAQVSHNTVENKKLLLDGLDYYLPDKDVLKVYKHLEENGIHCMPGGLWLKKQPADRREELLSRNPLLPFSIIMEGTQLEKAAALSESMAKISEDYPVAIIAADSEGVDYHLDTEIEGEEQSRSRGYLDSLKDSQVFILRSQNSRLLISEQELQAYVAGLGNRLSKSREEMTALKEDQNKIIGVKQSVVNFLNEYGLSFKNALEKEIKDLTEKVRFLENEAGRISEEQKKIKDSMVETQGQIQKTEAALSEILEDIKEIQSLMDTQKVIAECDRRIRELIPRLKELKTMEESIENQKRSVMEAFRGAEDKGREMEREATRLSKRLSQIKKELVIAKPTQTIQGCMEELEARVEAQKGKLSQGSRDAILEAMRAIEDLMESCRRTIRENGYREEDFEGVYEKVADSEIVRAEESKKQIEIQIGEWGEEYRMLEGQVNALTGSISTLTKTLYEHFGMEPYKFGEGDLLEPQFYDNQKKALKNKKNKLIAKQQEVSDRKRHVEKQLERIQQFIEYRKIEMPEGLRGDMLQLKGVDESIGLWDMMKMEPGEMAVLIRRYQEAYDEMQKKLDTGRKAVETCFESLYGNDAWQENTTLKSVLSDIMKEHLFNVKHMQDLFERLFETVGRMRDLAALQLEECKRNKGELIERCLQRAKTIYEEVKMVDTFSKIKVGGENRKVVKIEMPKWDEEQGKNMMALYLEKCIGEIIRKKEEGSYDPAKDSTIDAYMAPQALLDAVISLNDISIKVFKPEHNLALSQYIDWEVVIQWSGGEKLAGFFAMFISIITYLRYKRTGWPHSTKVIWIDNPFGQANAGHLLGYIFELAEATDTQMVCLTGLQETTIYAQFDVVYSLVHRMLSNMSILQPKQVKADQGVEVGYYHLKDGQMSFL